MKQGSRVSFLPSHLPPSKSYIQNNYFDTCFLTLSMDHMPQNHYSLVILHPVLSLLMLRHWKNLHLLQWYRTRPNQRTNLSKTPQSSAAQKIQSHKCTQSKVHFQVYHQEYTSVKWMGKTGRSIQLFMSPPTGVNANTHCRASLLYRPLSFFSPSFPYFSHHC